MNLEAIGIDIVDIPRFETLISEHQSFLRRYFHSDEQLLNPTSLAARFASKEALFKSGAPIFPNIFNQVLINFDSAGRPYFAIQKGLELVNLSNYLVSISHSKYSAIAVVIRLI